MKSVPRTNNHRKEHSSLRNPHDDVLISNGGEKMSPLGVYEYAEIFSGPSASIPGLDLPGLYGSGFPRPSPTKIDYSSIFGGFDDDVVAVPFEEVVNDFGKKSKNWHHTLEESVGVKHQFDISFNQISELNTNAANEIKKLRGVPRFTPFNGDKTQPLSLSCPSITSNNMDRTRSGVSGFGSKLNASGKINGEHSPPFLDEVLDETSVAMTALEKAIEQAQECMRIGKIIREKKRGGMKENVVYEEKNTRVERSNQMLPTFTRRSFEKNQTGSIKSTEKVSITSEIRQGKINSEEGELRNMQNDEMVGVRSDGSDDKENCEKFLPDKLKNNEEQRVHFEILVPESKFNGVCKPENIERNHKHTHETGKNCTQIFEYEASETVVAINMKKNTDLKDSDVPQIDDSEDNSVTTKFYDAIDFFPSDVKKETAGLVDALDEEKLPKDAFRTISGIQDKHSLSEIYSFEERAVKLDFSYLGKVLVQASRSEQELSSSSSENVKDCLDMNSRGLEEHRRTQLHSEPKDIEKFTKTKVDEQKDAKENSLDFDKDNHEPKERIAIQRAIHDARVRAFEEAQERAMALQRKIPWTTKYYPENISSSPQNTGQSHSFSSSNVDKLDVTNTESLQRRKARIEREQRIMKRVVKALEEKIMRDRAAQKELDERNRLAGLLDANIKRWVSRKEGNLRALLSTLHYILGADSGWKQISLNEVITAEAVKKAYRKATFCVHPDKLQQRRATIRQKYICEKIFFLLKDAWNRFNSDER